MSGDDTLESVTDAFLSVFDVCRVMRDMFRHVFHPPWMAFDTFGSIVDTLPMARDTLTCAIDTLQVVVDPF